MYTLLWLKSGGCGGDSISLMNLDHPDLYTALKMHDIKVAWFPSLSFESNGDVHDILNRFIRGEEKLDFLMVEGAVCDEDEDDKGKTYNVTFCGRPMKYWIIELAKRSSFTIAVGTCASFGGIIAAGSKNINWMGLQYFREKHGGLLGTNYRSSSGFPVINIAGCPAHPDWIMETLAFITMGKFTLDNLDKYQRPALFYSKLAHHACPRNEYYEFKASAEEYGQQGCLFENLGCKATQCESDCNERLWLGRTGSCTRGGFPCISCTSPVFPDGFLPFFETQKIEDIPTTLPLDVPKAWYVGISGMTKLACPKRLAVNATSFKKVNAEEIKKGKPE
jgi:Ni,Fe-hydrogenase I small subunit